MSPGSDKLCPGTGKYACIKVTWQPYVDGNNPGSHFYVQYKKSMETQYLATQEQLNQDSIIGIVHGTVGQKILLKFQTKKLVKMK